MKNIIIVFIFLLGNSVFAHQADISTITVTKIKTGQIVLQIASSMSAFQTEVNYFNPKDSYKTAQEFRKRVISHFHNSFSLIINGNDTLEFINPMVVLGHETKLVAELARLPEAVHSIHLKSKMFQEIHHNQSAVFFSIEGFPTDKNHVLSSENNYELNLELRDKKWQTIEKIQYGDLWKYVAALIILMIGSLVLYFVRKKKQVGSVENN